jgi:hypothetical protein
MVRECVSINGTVDEVEKIRKDRYKMNFDKAGAQIEAALAASNIPTAGAFGDLFKSAQRTLHSFTHSGIQQLRSRFDANDLAVGPVVASATCRTSPGLKRLSALLRWEMPQFASLWVKPGIPEIKGLMLLRKRAPEIRLNFRGYTPRVGAFIERDGACCFPCLVGQVRYLRGHSGPH